MKANILGVLLMERKTLGMMIAELRKNQGMTQLDLANKMGVTDKAVSKWERDLSCPDVNAFPHLADVLNVSVNELMQSKTENRSPKKNVKEIIRLLFKGVALAMGIAVVVLSVLDGLEAKSGITMLGIGLTCLAIDTLQDKE
ncbi:helix-turn-helix domain-containing protein [Anaeromassilibacillus senegalensis]|uniref:helix-turn-helix domain-containing protein n=1 Tax=Anaeromassilibacillus senegalensis TaxID=1673717 RepID=UPI002E8E60C1|nr:helix-turn-helix transcriptional regulator [Anaeromassilibacillus senegalensis]